MKGFKSRQPIVAVTTAKDSASGVAPISVDANGQSSITVIPGADGELRPRDLEKSLRILRAAGIILTQLEPTLETAEYLCNMAQRFQAPLMLDPAQIFRPAGPALRATERSIISTRAAPIPSRSFSLRLPTTMRPQLRHKRSRGQPSATALL